MHHHYVEFGIGNPTLISTEIEYADGSETRFAGARWPRRITSIYLRCWIGYAVIVVRRGGVQVAAKRRPAFKLLVGVAGISAGDE